MKKFTMLLLFLIVFTLTACTPKADNVTISFETFGGTEIAPITVAEGTLYSEIELPQAQKDNTRFEYWYETSEQVPILENKQVTADITLKAYFVDLVTVIFDDGTTQQEIIIDKGTALADVPTPNAVGFVFEYWYTDDEETAFDFSTKIESDITLHAKWDLTTEEKINMDIAYYEENMFLSDQLLYTSTKGHYYNSTISYDMPTDHISEHGVILSLLYGEEERTETFEVTFRLDGLTVTKEYEVTIRPRGEVVLTNSRIVTFENLSTEFDVADGQLELFYEDGGSVPYVNIEEFLQLLTGFIDPNVTINYVLGDDDLTMSYQYYDEEEDQLYDLTVVVDATENTFTVNDPAFFWAYTYSTETNYGRNINYINGHPDEYYEESTDIVYDLDLYNMDIVMKDDELLAPYYVVNQLFVGSSYYNVYYNYDGLYGIYLLPSESEMAYRTIHNSSVTGDDVPLDMLEATFNMLAFNLDYFYGLKDIMGIDTYYDLLYEVKDDLLTTDPDALDKAIADLLLKRIDEPHTSYGYMSYYSEEEPSTSSLSDYGSRFTNWYLEGLDAVNDVIGDRFGAASSGWNATRKPDYWFLDESTVMLSLNGFDTADIYEGVLFDQNQADAILKLDPSDFVLSDVSGDYFYLYNSSTLTDDYLEILAKQSDPSALTQYQQTLIADGFTLVTGTSNEAYKENGYLTKHITTTDGQEVDLFVLLRYDEVYELLYVGVAKKLPTDYSAPWPLVGDVETLVHSDSAVYMEETLENIMNEQPLVTDVILDLSWNTGGNVGALYRVLGFITDQPFIVSGIDRTTGTNSSYVVSITKANPYTDLNWSLLTTRVTFSAANSMTTIFRANNLGPIIGVQTGGGACSITPVLLPNGTAFTMSSNNISALRTGEGTELDPYVFEPVEFGLLPDYEIPLDDIYDADVLLNILGN